MRKSCSDLDMSLCSLFMFFHGQKQVLLVVPGQASVASISGHPSAEHIYTPIVFTWLFTLQSYIQLTFISTERGRVPLTVCPRKRSDLEIKSMQCKIGFNSNNQQARNSFKCDCQISHPEVKEHVETVIVM